MEESKLYCSHCGALITTDDYEEVNGEIVCTDCYERFTTTCDRCGNVIWSSDSYGDEYTTLCHHCYENHYTRCSCCDARYMRLTLIISTAMTTARNATMMKLTETVVSMIMGTNLSQFSTVIVQDISELSLK